MSRKNRVGTVKLLLSLDPTADSVIETLAVRGIFGKNKAEVASAILWKWIWENEEKLARQGVTFALKRQTGRKG